MSENKTPTDGGAAFPVAHSYLIQSGMSLRDYLAAKAMQGDWAAEVAGANGETMEDSARRYYKMADAMLKARERCTEKL
jgi:hypothetical protein